MTTHIVTALLLGLVSVGTAAGIVFAFREVPVLPGMAGCRFLADRHERAVCIGDRFVGAARDTSVPRALNDLQALAASSGKAAEACHDAGHQSAPKLFDRNRMEAQLLQAVQIKGDCADGYFHGTMITALGGNDTATREKLARFCAGDDLSAERMQVTCVHAIGHGFASEARLRPALESCEEYYPAKHPLASQCYSGVFMQHGMDRTESMRRTGNIGGHCAGIDELLMAYQCYNYIPSNAANLGWPSERAAAVCRDTPDRWTRTACMRGVGTGRLRDGGDFCLALRDTADASACMGGFFFRNLISFDELTVGQSVGMCTAADTARARHACAEALGFAWKSPLWPEPGLDTCRARLESSMRTACVRGYRQADPAALAGDIAGA